MTEKTVALYGAEFLNNMWEVNSGAQIITFLISLTVGAFFSVIYDIFKSVRICFRCNKLAVFFQDIAFCLICTFVTFCLCILRTKGQPRAFLVFAIAVGFFVWRLLLSRFFVFIFCAVLRFILKIKRRVESVLKAVFYKISKKCTQMFKKFQKKIKKGLKGAKGMLYNQLKHKRVTDGSGASHP